MIPEKCAPVARGCCVVLSAAESALATLNAAHLDAAASHLLHKPHVLAVNALVANSIRPIDCYIVGCNKSGLACVTLAHCRCLSWCGALRCVRASHVGKISSVCRCVHNNPGIISTICRNSPGTTGNTEFRAVPGPGDLLVMARGQNLPGYHSSTPNFRHLSTSVPENTRGCR